MTIPSDSNGTEFHGVVTGAESCGGEEKPQDLRISLSSPASQEVEQQKHQEASEQACKQVEGGGAQAHGKEEELPLGPEDRQRTGERPVHSDESSCVCLADLHSACRVMRREK